MHSVVTVSEVPVPYVDGTSQYIRTPIIDIDSISQSIRKHYLY